MTEKEYADRYNAAAHAMQSAVAMSQEVRSGAEPKGLRVAVNTALADQASLARLLMDKGVITSIEYYRALADGMEKEAEVNRERAAESLGVPVDRLHFH